MFVASRRVIQGAIRVKVHRIVRDVVVHMQCSVFFLQPSRAHGPYRTEECMRARARVHATLHARSSERQTERKRDRRERDREREREGRMIAGGRGDDKKGEEAADALVCFLSLRCSPGETSVSVRTCVRARVCVDDRRTLPPLCVRLHTFAISLNPQTTSVRVGVI